MLIRGHHVFGERREEKREKKARVARDQVLVGFAPHFLLLRDQTTWKRRFEEAKVRKSNLTSSFCDFRFGEKALTWVNGFLLDPTHFWSCLRWIPWWDVRFMSLYEEMLIIVGENW